jgi:hypothetical protein
MEEVASAKIMKEELNSISAEAQELLIELHSTDLVRQILGMELKSRDTSRTIQERLLNAIAPLQVIFFK